MTNRSNEEWLRLLAARDPGAMAELWVMLIEWSLTSAYKRHQTEDLGRDAAVQAFERIVNSVSSFSGDGSFLGWCRVIIVHEVLRLLDRQQRQITTVDDSTTVLEELPAEDLQIEIDPKTIRGRLQPCISGLKKREKQVIEGFYYRELTPQILADKLNIQVNYVHQLLHQARKKLQRCLKELGFMGADDLLSL